MLAVDRKYIFIQLGGNQIRTTEKNKLHSIILDMVVFVRNKNPASRIFFIAVLPRVVDNELAKPLITRFNRWLSSIVNKINVIFERIRFLPVHLHFIDGVTPKRHLFDEQEGSLLLSLVGAAFFKQVVFQAAGFVKNV